MKVVSARVRQQRDAVYLSAYARPLECRDYELLCYQSSNNPVLTKLEQTNKQQITNKQPGDPHLHLRLSRLISAVLYHLLQVVVLPLQPGDLLQHPAHLLQVEKPRRQLDPLRSSGACSLLTHTRTRTPPPPQCTS